MSTPTLHPKRLYNLAIARHMEQIEQTAADLMHHLRLMSMEADYKTEVQKALTTDYSFFVTNQMVMQSKDKNICVLLGYYYRMKDVSDQLHRYWISTPEYEGG